jgi:GT2 family glycosyltransferase
MTFEPDLMEKLLADMEPEDGPKRQAVSGLCFGRRPPFKPCIYKSLDVQQQGQMIYPKAEVYLEYPRDQLFEVAACGFACVMMRMDVLEAMGIYGVPFFPVGGLGEDLTFCWRAQKIDVKFHCDSRLKIGHIMRIHVDEAFRDNVFQGSAEN